MKKDGREIKLRINKHNKEIENKKINNYKIKTLKE